MNTLSGLKILNFLLNIPENNYCIIKFKSTSEFTLQQDIVDILGAIKPMVNADVTFKAALLLYDIYGNESDDIMIVATFTNDTIQKTTSENVLSTNFRYIADEWWNHKYLN